VALRGKLMPWALHKKPLKKQLYLSFTGRKHLNNAAALHCTIAEEEQAVKDLSLDAPTFVVANAVDLSGFEEMPERGFYRRKFGIPDDEYVLLTLGRLFHVKRPDIAVNTLSAVRANGVKAHLILAGPDSESMIPALKTQARELVITDYVHFTGLLEGDDVLRVLADADLLLMPSEVTENFGRSAAEAMAAGLPIIVSKGISIGAWAVQAGAGMQVDCTNEAFAQAAMTLLSQPDTLPEMGRRGADVAQREFASDMVAQKMLAHYRAIVQTGAPLGENAYRVS
jgi:glycosyltransferase involved in cell wall biosynthesis